MRLKEITDQLHEVFEGYPWFGKSISDYLQEVPGESLNFSMNGGHSVGQIINHMIVWREYVIDQMAGLPPKVTVGGPGDWTDARFAPEDKNPLFARFRETQRQLIQTLQMKDDSLLEQPVSGKPFTMEKLLVGIIQHDIYHLGQIFLLNTAFKNQKH